MLSWGTDYVPILSIEVGFVSELYVKAEQISTSTSQIKYKIVDGVLPSGLSLLHDGSIAGRVDYQPSYLFAFTVEAVDTINNESSTQIFNINVSSSTSTQYTSVYTKPFLNPRKRQLFEEFINNEEIFKPSFLYRPWDNNFGVQKKLKLVIEFGIEISDISYYAEAMAENFYNRKFLLGTPKIAYANDGYGNPLYEVVYVDVIDSLVNTEGTSLPLEVSLNNNTYYPSTIENMQIRLQSTKLDNTSTVSIRDDLQPRFMLTQSISNFRSVSYLKVVPLCYTLPRKGVLIVNNIKKSKFKFNNINFEIDRIVVENSVDNQIPQYLIFPKHKINGS